MSFKPHQLIQLFNKYFENQTKDICPPDLAHGPPVCNFFLIRTITLVHQ